MKIVSARMNHETNTYISVPLAAFGLDGPTFGVAVRVSARGTRTALGGSIRASEARGATIIDAW